MRPRLEVEVEGEDEGEVEVEGEGKVEVEVEGEGKVEVEVEVEGEGEGEVEVEVEVEGRGGKCDLIPFSRYNAPVPGWFVYLLRCGDGTLYAGATNDVEARLAAHRAGKGARYTRGRGPLALVHCERHADRSAALRREWELKRLSRADKLALLLDSPRDRGKRAHMRKLAPLALVLLFGCPKPPAYPECRNDDDCSGHAEVCINNVCRECRDDAQCAKKPGTVCVNNACQPKAQCQTNRDCPQGQKCAQNQCVPECTEATAEQDCGSGRKCLSGRCAAADACNVDSDCGSGQACIQNRCRAAQACKLETVYFGFDDSSLSSEARGTLDADRQCLQQRGDPAVTVAGHCDERGTTEYNVALGQRRAESVRKYLIGLGAEGSKIKVVSYGKERPADPGHNEAAWEKNRRAEITAGAAQ